jgi:hypothetical protein
MITGMRMQAEFVADGGLAVEIGRDGILCTEAVFGWDSKHDNEPQD